MSLITNTPFTSSIRKTLDLPVWEWLRFNPIANTATAWSTCTQETGNDRYVYFLGTTFYRYDTWTDGWQQLATPNTALSTACDLRYTSYQGHRCRTISGSLNTITMPALTGQILVGNTIKIVEGTGRGQLNTITSVSDPIIYDGGILTTATALQLTDSTKKWKFNQWAGYQCRITYNAGAAQVRTILYNDATNLYFSDTNYQAIDSWNNTGFAATAPYAIPVSTAGVQSAYVIEVSTLTLANNWITIPDITSKIVVFTGGIWMLSSAAATPFFTFQFYDVIEDAWITKTANQILAAALSTDCSMEKFVESAGVFDSGSFVTGNSLFSSSAPNSYINDTTKSWPTDRYVNFQARIVGGTGIGQKRRIIAMSGSSLQVERNWDVSLDTSSLYNIYGDTDKLYAFIGGSSQLFQYHTEADIWSHSDIHYTGISRNWSAKWYGSSSYEPIALTSIAKNTGAIISLSSSPTAAGTGYTVGDTFNITTTGTNGKGRVTSTTGNGLVAGVEIFAVGSGYAVASGLATTAILGVGSGLTVQVLGVGSAGRITTAMNHFFQRGDNITLQGTTDSTWNINYQILGADSLTTFDITGSLTSVPTAASSQGATTLVDSNANWTTNELVGKIVQKYLVGSNGTPEVKRVTANTATTLTIGTAWTANPVNGTGRYVIGDPNYFGRDEQYKPSNTNGRGYALSGTSSMLYDSTKSWAVNQWSSYRIRIVAGTGFNNEISILNNTPNTLSFAVSQSFSPDSSSKYLIMDTFGAASGGSITTLSDATKNWTVNQWAGKRVKMSTGATVLNDTAITSNTANSLTFASTTSPTTDTTYAILSPPAKGAGMESSWAWGLTDSNRAGKHIWCPDGGGSTKFNKYDITTTLWEYGIAINPITETLNTGTMYAYDGMNRIYFTTNATGRVFYLDLTTNRVIPFGITPYAHGAAISGNRMEVVQSVDGLQFLIIFRHTGQEIWRSLIYV